MNRKINIALNALYLLIVFAILVTFLVGTWNIAAGNLTMDSAGVNDATFGLILTGITIVLASSIIIPRISLASKVEEEIDLKVEEIKTQIEAEYKEIYERKFLNETRRVDAHLSRMISYLLVENESKIWALGWTLRAARRYVMLIDEQDNIGLREYSDLFQQLVFHVDFISSKMRPKEPTIDGLIDNFEEIIAEGENDFLSAGFQEEKITSNVRMAIRFLKDYFDLELLFRNRLKLHIEQNNLSKENTIKLPRGLAQVFLLLNSASPIALGVIATISNSTKRLQGQAINLARQLGEISYSKLWDGEDLEEYKISIGKIQSSLTLIGDESRKSNDVKANIKLVVDILHAKENSEYTLSLALQFNKKDARKVVIQG